MSGTFADSSGYTVGDSSGYDLADDVLAVTVAPSILGSVDDFAARLRSLLPRSWFPDQAPVLQGLLAGFAAPLSTVWDLLVYVQRQTRLDTATGAWLDGKAQDFLGPAWLRRLNESDTAFSARTRREIVRPRNTRAAIVQVLQDLTGNTPTVLRPSNPADCGGWGTGAMGYGAAGAWGSLALPFQAFVTIDRGTAPGAGGAPTLDDGGTSGWGSPLGGYGAGSLAWANGAPAQGGVTDDDIYAAVASVTPAGHVNWVQITGAPALPHAWIPDVSGDLPAFV